MNHCWLEWLQHYNILVQKSNILPLGEAHAKLQSLLTSESILGGPSPCSAMADPETPDKEETSGEDSPRGPPSRGPPSADLQNVDLPVEGRRQDPGWTSKQPAYWPTFWTAFWTV